MSVLFWSMMAAEMIYLSKLFHESINEALQNLIRVANLLSVLSDDPYQRPPSVRLIQLVNVFAKGGNHAFVARIFAQDILCDHNDLLYDVVDFGRDQILQSLHAFAAGFFDLDGDLTDGLDGSANKVHVHLQSILLQLRKQLLEILLVCYPYHDLELLELDIGRVIVFAEEDSQFFAENIGFGLEK